MLDSGLDSTKANLLFDLMFSGNSKLSWSSECMLWDRYSSHRWCHRNSWKRFYCQGLFFTFLHFLFLRIIRIFNVIFQYGNAITWTWQAISIDWGVAHCCFISWSNFGNCTKLVEGSFKEKGKGIQNRILARFFAVKEYVWTQSLHPPLSPFLPPKASTWGPPRNWVEYKREEKASKIAFLARFLLWKSMFELFHFTHLCPLFFLRKPLLEALLETESSTRKKKRHPKSHF